MACSAIGDLRDNPLGGGSGFSLDFAAAGNLLANPNFDLGIAGWSLSDPQADFAAADAARAGLRPGPRAEKGEPYLASS